jgi:hypothetical protein
LRAEKGNFRFSQISCGGEGAKRRDFSARMDDCSKKQIITISDFPQCRTMGERRRPVDGDSPTLHARLGPSALGG